MQFKDDSGPGSRNIADKNEKESPSYDIYLTLCNRCEREMFSETLMKCALNTYFTPEMSQNYLP